MAIIQDLSGDIENFQIRTFQSYSGISLRKLMKYKSH
jgi:hypothetical protein